MDVLTPEQRRLNMSRIRGQDTRPELLLRRGLHALGLRFRLHARELPGRPDLIFPKYHVAIFVNGCFWHGHSCHLGVIPATRRDFWTAKIAATRLRDQRVAQALAEAGWRVLTIWECALRGRNRLPLGNVMKSCEAFIRETSPRSDEITGEIRWSDTRPSK